MTAIIGEKKKIGEIGERRHQPMAWPKTEMAAAENGNRKRQCGGS